MARGSISRLMSIALLAIAVAAVPRPEAQGQSVDDLAKDPNLFLRFAAEAMKWEAPAEPFRIAGPIHFVGTEGLGAFLIETSEGLILLNSGMPSSGPMIEASIRKLGFDPRDLKLILASHAHVDHAGGHAYLKEVSGAKVAIIAEEEALLASGGRSDFFYKGAEAFAYDPVTADVVFRDGDTLTLGDAALTAYLTPGHTRGSTTFTMRIVEAGKTYLVAFPDGAGINPGYRVRVDPSFPGLYRDYRRTLGTLEAIEPDIWLGYHNEGYGFGEKRALSPTLGIRAWIDPGGYRAFVDAQRRKLEDTIAAETAAP